MKRIMGMAFVVLMGLTGCGSNEEYSEYERVEASFLNRLEGNISPLQWWKTAVTLKVNVVTESPVKIWLASAATGGILYDYKEVTSSGLIEMTAPQGQGNTIYLITVCNRRESTQAITLSGKQEEVIQLNTLTATRSHEVVNNTDVATTRSAKSSVLYGESVAGNAGHYQFTDEQMPCCMDIIAIIDINGTDAEKLGLNCDYELESNGPFYITWLSGFAADNKSRILGYYWHSPGTYSDIKYVDLSETHKYDYIDGLAKVQYQISHDDLEYGLQANQWHDANFDLNDYFGSTSSGIMQRIGDDAFNMQFVYKRFGYDITALRGISFAIDVPAGKRLGFYLRSDEESFPGQFQRIQKLGVPTYVNSASLFKGCCFSAKMFNTDGTHRSFIKDYGEMMFMGMEDIVMGGDHDCNDVIFGVTTEMDIYKPDIVAPDIEPAPEFEGLLPWTIAYEDVSRQADFDFNDAVIKIVPDYTNELCCVTVMAAGSTSRMYLHYDGPDGDQNLGEIHELLNREAGTIINTNTAVASIPFVEVDCVKWPKEYTVASDARRFYIEIQRGTCTDCNDLITLAYQPGQLPQALLVAGEWKWPTEETHLFDAYTASPQWAKDATKTNYWTWYSIPKSGSIVSY